MTSMRPFLLAGLLLACLPTFAADPWPWRPAMVSLWPRESFVSPPALWNVTVDTGERIYSGILHNAAGNELPSPGGAACWVMISNGSMTLRVSRSQQIVLSILHETGVSYSGAYDLRPDFTQAVWLRTLLELTPDQQAKVFPILSVESRDRATIRKDSTASATDKAQRLKQVLAASNTALKPILTDEQWEKLVLLRQRQTREIDELEHASTRK